jgi:hypothetical protein
MREVLRSKPGSLSGAGNRWFKGRSAEENRPMARGNIIIIIIIIMYCYNNFNEKYGATFGPKLSSFTGSGLPSGHC